MEPLCSLLLKLGGNLSEAESRQLSHGLHPKLGDHRISQLTAQTPHLTHKRDKLTPLISTSSLGMNKAARSLHQVFFASHLFKICNLHLIYFLENLVVYHNNLAEKNWKKKYIK
jgi:hypothetical protein